MDISVNACKKSRVRGVAVDGGNTQLNGQSPGGLSVEFNNSKRLVEQIVCKIDLRFFTDCYGVSRIVIQEIKSEFF